MKFEFLADRPDALELVARWYYEEWGRGNPESSVEIIARKISMSMNSGELPCLVLAVDKMHVLGVVELKYREMAIYPDKEHWLGGLFVPPAHRGRSIGAKLVEHAIDLAEQCGVKKLYLQTEQLDGGIYACLGWRPLERVNNKGIEVLVMERDIGR